MPLGSSSTQSSPPDTSPSETANCLLRSKTSTCGEPTKFFVVIHLAIEHKRYKFLESFFAWLGVGEQDIARPGDPLLSEEEVYVDF